MTQSKSKVRGAKKRLYKPGLNAGATEEIRRIVLELAKRKIEGLKLYRPMPIQEAFHSSKAKERIIRGSNRSGKTLAACVEVARAVTGQDPLDRYPKENGVWYIVGKDGREIATVLYRKLFRAGAFKIVRDIVTGEWRAFMPNSLDDAGREKVAKPAPPLIPRRFIKSIAWEIRSENLPKIVTLANGWELHFFSSNAKPPHGADIHGALFDEEIVDPDWYPEIAARLVDHSGHFIWSATPQAGTEQLFELHEKAEREQGLPADKRIIEEFVSLIDDNEHLTPKQKREFASKLNADQHAVRIGGEFAVTQARVFPEYWADRHHVECFQIPQEWTRYVAIDPGRQICAGLFCAIPPPDCGDLAFLFDEFYLENCTAELFGRTMGLKCAHHSIEAFIIDHQESRKFETASGRTIEEQYSEALMRYKVSCHRTGHGFLWGAADPIAGVEAIRSWLQIRDTGDCKLRVMADKCPNFVFEMRRYRYKKRGDIITESPEDRGRVHLMACLRYIVQERPRFIPRALGKPKPNAVWLAAQRIMNPGGGKSINFGPGKFFGA